MSRGWPIYFLFIILLGLDFALLWWASGALSISYSESQKFFYFQEASSYLAHFGAWLFGQDDRGVRLPFVLLHLLNALLLFIFSLDFLKRKSDALLCVLLFMLLPGVNMAALLVSNSGIVIFFVLSFCLLYQKKQQMAYWLFGPMVFVEQSFGLVFLALVFFGIAKKDTFLVLVSLVFFTVSMYVFGLGIGGYPRGYFLDTNGLLMVIFSPFVFFYLLYVLYAFKKEPKPLIWYIALCALLFVWLASLRQRVELESFGALLVVGLPLMVRAFFWQWRVRLPQFRGKQKALFVLSVGVLGCSCVALFSQKALLAFCQQNINPSHFLPSHFLAKELAQSLKQEGIVGVMSDHQLQERLRFYGIAKNKNYQLTQDKSQQARKIDIIYYHRVVASFYLSP